MKKLFLGLSLLILGLSAFQASAASLEIKSLAPTNCPQAHFPYIGGNSNDVVFSCFTSLDPVIQSIFINNADGTSPRTLFVASPGKSAFWPTISADGTRVVFNGSERGGWDIYAANTDGSNLRRISSYVYSDDNISGELYPRISGNGEKVVFLRDFGSGQLRLNIMDYDGTNIKKLTDLNIAGMPSINHTGTKIAFNSNGAIFTVNPDGSDLQQIYSDENNIISSPTISGDGSKIAFISSSQSAPYINNAFTMDVTGSNVRQVASNLGTAYLSINFNGSKLVVDEAGLTGRQLKLIDTINNSTINIGQGFTPGINYNGSIVAYNSGLESAGAIKSVILSEGPPKMINPTDTGTLKCEFNCKPNHEGIDIDKTLYQKPVMTTADGTVVRIDNVDDSAAGKWVWIYHGNIAKKDGASISNISTRYLHLDSITSSLYVGQSITQGTIIGTAGGTGGSITYVPHLHFEVRQGSTASLDYRQTVALDPLGFVSYQPSIFSIAAFSPVDIEVIDPDGLIINKARNDFGSVADYFEPKYVNIPDDGEAIHGYDLISFDQKKDGDYLVKVLPEAGALPNDTFTLRATVCGTSTMLSVDTPVSDIPGTPYVVRLTGCSFEKFIPTKIVTPELNSEYILGSQIQVQFSAVDNLFGTANISATLNGESVINGDSVFLSSPGVNVLIITATDNNGYSTTLTKTFNVVYGTSGFLPPIKTDGSGIYNQGRTLPVKFQLTDNNGVFVSSAINNIYVAKISNGVVGTDEMPLSSSSSDTGNQFRYDTLANQYIFNLNTSTLSTGTWWLKAVLDDGKEFGVLISIK